MSYLKMRLTIFFGALFICGLIFTIKGVSETTAAENAEKDFNYMSRYEFEDGMYVKGRVYEIYDEFAVEETEEKTYGVTTNKRVSSRFYVVPMVGTFESDTPMYIAVEISHVGMIEEAEKLMQQTWDYYDYGTEPAVWNEFDIQGKVTPLDAELLGYFYEWFMYGDEGATRADYEPYICPYLITYRNVSSTTNVFTIVLTAIGAIGLTVILMLHLKNNSTPKNTYNQYAYNSNPVVPPYSPDSVKDMTDRGFPPPEPVVSAVPQPVSHTDSYGNSVQNEELSMPVAEKVEKSTTDSESSDDWWRAYTILILFTAMFLTWLFSFVLILSFFS